MTILTETKMMSLLTFTCFVTSWVYNNVAICPKTCHIDNIKNKAIKAPKTNTTKEKKVLVNWVRKKSSNISIFISKLIKHPTLDVQALFIKTNIIILALHLFQISPKSRKEIKRLMTIFCKLHKKKIILPVFIKKKELYMGFDYLE